MANQWLFKSETHDNCNCAVNCGCQFNLPSTHGYCQSAFVGSIIEGDFNHTPLAGLKWAGLYKWPGEIKEGNGKRQIVIDERADEAQREREARKYHLNPTPLLAGDDLQKVAADFGFPGSDDLLAAIGYGKSSVHQVLNKLAPNALLEPPERPKASQTRPAPTDGVRIRGVDDLLVRFARCCNPLPGDPIVGFITRGRGLTVHARDCLTVARSVLDRERLIDVEWDVAEPGKRPVRIAVYIGQDRPGLLSEITGAISARDGNITKAEVTVTDDRRGINHFVVEVADVRQLQDIIQSIREVRDVINVERIRGL